MKRSAILLTVDRLGASYLGPYGNTWLETPSFNRMAADCQLYEHVTAESLQIRDFAHTLLSTRHTIGHAAPTAAHGLPLIDQLHNQGIPIIVITDDPIVAALTQGSHVEETVLLEGTPSQAADRLEGTSLFNAFAAAIATLEEIRGDVWVWVHVGSLGRIWDAPWEYRDALCDEGDPEPWDEILAPRMSIDAEKDPDELFQLTMAYAAQVRVLDECVGLFWDQLHEAPQWQESLLICGGTRGFPLGEHLRIGDADEQLFGESLRLPLLIRNPLRPRCSRHLEQVQPVDWSATVADWFGVSLTEPADRLTGRSLLKPSTSLAPLDAGIAVSISDAGAAIRTPAWFYTRRPEQAHLFVKPDDQWEINDVLDRCNDIGQELHQLLDRVLAQGQSGQPWESVPPTFEHLMQHFE